MVSLETEVVTEASHRILHVSRPRISFFELLTRLRRDMKVYNRGGNRNPNGIKLHLGAPEVTVLRFHELKADWSTP